jgi:SAM-dependent methyltransferase
VAVQPVRRHADPVEIGSPGRTRALSERGRERLERASLEDVTLHPLAAQGFADVADAYDRGRPDYPAGVVDLLEIPAGARVLDLAAGTGKLTRLLRSAGLDVVPVEPLAAMRAKVPRAIAGTAEAIPLADASVDAATIADAWHWFDHARARDELARVVRPGGLIAVLWQYPSGEDVPEWSHAFGEILASARGDHPGFAHGGPPPLSDHPAFEPQTEHVVPFTYEADRERYLAFVSSMSFVASRPPEEREDILRRVAEVLPDGPFSVGYATRVWLSRRRG